MEPNMIQPGDPVYRKDIWDLSRFIEAQQNTYDTVVSELSSLINHLIMNRSYAWRCRTVEFFRLL